MTHKFKTFLTGTLLAAVVSTPLMADNSPLSAIPFFEASDSTAGQFTVKTVRKTSPTEVPPVTTTPLPDLVPEISMGKTKPKIRPAKTKNVNKAETASSGTLTLSRQIVDGEVETFINGVRALQVFPGKVDISRKDARMMKKVKCQRAGASHVDMGFPVYSSDGVAIGYMSDLTTKSGAALKDFQVVTFPSVTGAPVCLQFDKIKQERMKGKPIVTLSSSQVKYWAQGILAQ